MGGIAGVVYPDAFQVSDLVAPMLDMMSHRGAVGDTYTYKNVQLGCCGVKLASNDKKTVIVALDGVITNNRQVKQELRDAGYKFSGENDSEMVIHAYDKWRGDFLEHFTGAFSLFLYDQEKNEIILARDRMGKKPLYWYQDQHHFIFASEIKALLATGAVPQTPALDGLSTYLYFGYIPQDMSPVQNVSKLLPAHYLRFNNRDGSKSIEPFWSYSSYFEKRAPGKRSFVIEHLDELLRTSVERVMPDTNPVGCFISGGLGSASVAYYAQMLGRRDQVSAFTVGFQGINNEDVDVATEVASELEIPQTVGSITPKNFLDDLVKIAWYLDEPQADPNVIATWGLAALASKSTMTVLSGMGSDELLAGHSRYTVTESDKTYQNQLKQWAFPILTKMALPFLKVLHKPLAFSMLKQSRTNPWIYEYLLHNAVFDIKTIAKASPKLYGLFDPEVFLHKFHHLHRISSNVGAFLYFDMKTRLPDLYIQQYERLTTANGLKWFSPYLEREIIEYLARVPEPSKLTESETAQFLKAILNPVFSPDIVNRPKRTRKSLLKDWIRQSDLEKVFKLLVKGRLVESGLISEQWLSEKTKTVAQQESNFTQLWSILALEIWFRLYISSPVTKAAPNKSVIELLTEP